MAFFVDGAMSGYIKRFVGGGAKKINIVNNFKKKEKWYAIRKKNLEL